MALGFVYKMYLSRDEERIEYYAKSLREIGGLAKVYKDWTIQKIVRIEKRVSVYDTV